VRDEILRKQNKFKEATQNLRKLVMFKKNTIADAEKSYGMIKEIQMSLANTELRNKVLKARHDRLSLNAVVSLATLRHNELEHMNLHQRMNMIARQQQQQVARHRLMFEHQRQLAIQRDIIDEQHLYHIRLKVIIVVLITSALLIVFFILYSKRRKKYIARLTVLEQSTADALREAEVLHQEAQKLLSKAEEADKLKSHFLQNISYGVRTSLNAIVGFSGLISNDSEKVDKNAEKYFTSLVEHESSKLTSFINDILDIANLTTGKYKMQYNAVTLPELCDSALSYAAGHAKEGVDTRAQYADELYNLVVYLDVQRINQVLQKLLDNACKFTEKGTIYLSCAVAGNKIVFCVTDTGMEIPEDKSEIIFNRFVKLNEFMPGFGLGLSICKAVADRVDGRVWHDTNYKSGARFYFEMPLTIQPPKEGGEQ
jgi:signal transduction histidine kinase